ncbi:ectonucleotide pyrophosphatase/phosphodiesterase [Bowmanella sp. JS7-9]|uniref:Ectonucleotide pyrophosphatase/phosphodiesterase n=1 Tax=Pseudobowmanella zhangzhouensis TaxID=1537679 RepID=A0ABW1XPR8_9ALTE|nr:ectonucleotide pyrophosphatase/phosphodiesterase [Bowmanella sp. JS7-9]TBX20578.1 hypothetical protein TK45_14800 [Bowmanella sp. JS7-9]
MARLIFIGIWLVLGLTHADAAETSTDSPYVVLVSIDGFRWDYIEKHQALNIARIAANGVRAKRLTPVYPANTFPSHLSIVTGLHPGHHGIVANRFYDKQRNEYYEMGQGKQDASWVEGIPLWNLAEMQGIKAAAMFWPESDARINGRTPSYFYHYAHNADYQWRVEQILDWLRLPEVQRPHFITGYFSIVDSKGHEYGPDAAQTRAAVQKVDRLVGQLYDGILQLGLPVNLVLVSDHGMTYTDPNQAIKLDELELDGENFQWVNDGSHLMIYGNEDTSDARLQSEVARLSQLQDNRFRVVDVKERQRRGLEQRNRGGDILIEAVPPARFSKGKKLDIGAHGYPPELADMGALFVATGPAFKQGVSVGELHALSIYPSIARILGLELMAPVDGDITPLLPALN